jgi:LacI family transcriptional regulator
MGTATLADVAREAGVSVATASRVLNPGVRKVAEEYRDRVLAAAARLDYTANLAAQATARGLSSTVTLLLPDITDPYFSMIAAGVSEAAEEAGLMTTIALTRRDPAREVQLVRTLRGQRPQVMVLAGSRQLSGHLAADLSRELEAYAGIGGRPVFLSQSTTPYPAIDFRNHQAGRELATAVIGLGYRRPLILGGPAHLVTTQERCAGLRAGAEAAGVAIGDDRVIACDLSRDGGYAAASGLPRELLAESDVVFAISDVIAIGAMTALRERGVGVPDQVAIAGFDDVPAARDAVPALTTVRLPLVEAGRAAVLSALHAEEPPANLSGSVVLRDSTPSR